jgi:eukaryotic translation initiation factor 2C
LSHLTAVFANVLLLKVLIGSGAEKRGLIKAVWESTAVQTAIGKGFIFDGNKIGW